MALDENSIIDRFFRPLAGEGAFGLRDDAGVLSVAPGCELVVTTDMIAAGVHFLPGDPPETTARKALRVNLSDLAAKGATPLSYVLALGLGPDADEAWLADFAHGLQTDQDAFGLKLLGGDTISVAEGAVISVTAFGCVPQGKMVHRFGGQAGDALYVSGTIGAATAGLAILKGRSGPWDELSAADRAALVGRYRVPEPRLTLSRALVEFASAAMDISDGLVGDCDKLAAASGCAAAIAAERVPLPAGLAPRRDDCVIVALLTGGDDYEILAAVPPPNKAGFEQAAQSAGVTVTEIGALAPAAGETEVLFEGLPLRLHGRSFVHGRNEETR